MVILWLATVSRCDEPHPAATKPEPKSGDYVKLRGTLGEDVDCRTLHVDGGRTYSLSARLPNYRNGIKLCLEGTVVDATQCMTTPMIEVQSIRAWSSCP